MTQPTQSVLSSSTNPAVAAALLAGSVAFSPSLPVHADDVNIHPSSCQAPYLDQAFPMRWHENYLMNPTSGVDTWVICPITFDNDDWTAGQSLDLKIVGGVMSGASGSNPSCYFSVHDARNLNQPPFVSGPATTFTTAFSGITKSGSLWETATLTIPYDWIASALGTSKNDWGASIFCLLPVGHGISQMQLVQ